MPEPLYLLDTNVLLALIRGSELGRRIDARYKLTKTPFRPLACIVSHGEIRALAEANGWSERKRQALSEMLANVTTVDISDEQVIDAYVDVYMAYRRHPKGDQTNAGENDFWIAAAARATKATLLTTDKHFKVVIPRLVSGDVIDPKGK